MEEVYNYIEAYFTNTLGAGEREAFEERCVNDKAFAADVAFYIAARQEIRQQLLQQKQHQWAHHNNRVVNSTAVESKAPVRTMIRRVVSYAAAACIILSSAVYFLFSNPSSYQLANNYAQNNLSYINPTMGGGPDSLQTAIAAFNSKDYKKALQLFEMLAIKNPGNADEKKYTGLVYLFTQDYDKALQHFDALAKMQLLVNPGNFLKAVTLMERDKDGDKEQAKRLLEQVVRENTEGSRQAGEWLKKL